VVSTTAWLPQIVVVHPSIGKVVRQQDMRNRFLQQGVELTASESSDRFSAFIRHDLS